MASFLEGTANVVALVHILYFLFVVFGLLLTLTGALRRWRWVRNFWFRAAHLALIGTVIIEDWMGWECPLIPLEEWLRRLGGSASGVPSGPVGALLDHWLFGIVPPAWLDSVYIVGGVLVAALWLAVPPRNVIQSQSKAQ